MSQSLTIGDSYSDIISPADYNRIITKEHIYIAAADNVICQIIQGIIGNNPQAEVVEIGSGPGRITDKVHVRATPKKITCVDTDKTFLDFAKSNTLYPEKTTYVRESALHYNHPTKVDIFYSQGFHHHIAKGNSTETYLSNLYSQLTPGGVYILSDEFLPDYSDNDDREIKAIIWYSHVISHALKHNFVYLAKEEAKTLIDDIYEGRGSSAPKSPAQINLVTSRAVEIDNLNKISSPDVEYHAQKLLSEIENLHNKTLSGDKSIDLSRGDFKICEKVLKEEIIAAGFTISESKHIGGLEKTGGMSIYLLTR